MKKAPFLALTFTLLLLGHALVSQADISSVTLKQCHFPTGIGDNEQQIVCVKIAGSAGTYSLTELKMTMGGTTNITDVTSVKVRYNAKKYKFYATSPLFGAAQAPSAGTLTFSGSQSFTISSTSDTVSFWIVYDISASATEGNLVDAVCSSVIISGTTFSPTNVTGSRTILLSHSVLAQCGDYGSLFYRIPAMVTCPDGSLLAAYDKRWNNGEDIGVTATNSIDVVCRRSTDKGETWSEPVTIAGNHSTNCFGDPCLFVDNTTGTIFCLMAYGTGTANRFSASTPSNPIRIYKIESHDNGLTWTNLVDITNSIYGSQCADATRRAWYAGVVSPGSGIQMSNGRLATLLQVRTSSSTSVIHDFLIYSDDHGVTWTCGTNSAYAAGAGNEAQLVEKATSGNFLASIRHTTNRYMNTSSDYGITWGTVYSETEITEPGCNGDIARLTTIAGGSDKNRLVQSIPFHATIRTNMSVMLSNDDGTNWPYRKVIFPGMGSTQVGSAYSCLAVLPDNTIGLIFELSDTIPYNGAWAWPYEQIHFARFSLNWLTGGAESLCQPATLEAPTSNSPQCANASITFTQGSCPAGYTCYWQTSPTGISTGNSSSTLTITQPAGGYYTAYLRGYNGSCWTQAVSTVGYFKPVPTGVTASASDNSICTGDAINLTSTATNTETLISPTLEGSFDPGTTFAANGWTAVNGASNTWYCGSYAGVVSGNNAAYIGTATSYAGTSAVRANHLYRDITIPSGATNIVLRFYLMMPTIDNGADYLRVYTTTTGYTPVAGTTPGTGYTQVFNYTTPALSSYTLQTVSLPDALAGTTVRLVFTYISDATTGNANPAIDNISLTANYATYSWTSSPAGFTSSLQNPTSVTPTATTNYTVAASGTNGCSESASTTVTVTSVTPTFTQLGPYCQGDVPGTLPTTSTNSITGSWSPSTISTATAGTTTYTFTPAAGQCASVVTMDVTVSGAATTPTFAQLGPYCVGATPAALPTTSTNGITGSWSPSTISTASAGSTVYTFTPTAGQCATTATMTVVVNANVTPTFTQLGPYCVGATPAALPTTSNNSITGTWSPSTISTASAGSTVYTFTPTAGQCATTKTMTVVVNANVTPTFTQLGPYCVGATPAALPTTSTNSITGTWSPSTISTASAGSTVYTFTPTAGQCATTATMTVVVNANVTPTFTQLGPYCVGATPAALPTTSTNSITGTWSPSTISTASAGSTVYTFTPTAGQCATTATMTIVLNANVTPVFTQLGPYCVGATAEILPTTSSNGITGTWNAAISTATAGSTVYTFIPDAGQCATTATMTVVVNANVTPTFTQLGPYCVGATPGTLPTTSNNSITGTWSPATISTASAGSTVYTFTPTAGQCATTATMTVVVNANITPTFTQLGPYCVGATPAALPTTSTNSITGTWSPSTISTASAGSTVYTFTPTAGQCATTATMTVVVNANVTPTFTQLGPYCVGATPAALPTTSTNSITGTWSPSTISTASAGSTVYTFTPTAGQCATTKTMTVVVNANVTPTFTQPGPYCVGTTPAALPTTSTNSITGTWSPSTISTASAGSTVYTFTPTAGQCATTETMTVVVNANVTPTFTQLGPYCVGATPGTLPTTSNNSITGTWSPSTISTASAGSTVYTFTPTAGQCATTATMTVVVNANITPIFTQLGPYCVGATPAALPTTSTNSITGSWSPSTISTASAGSTVYTFTPTAGQCATTATMTVVVNANVTPIFTQLGPYCVGATPAALPTTSTNSITGTWSPSTISTASAGSTVYTFTPTGGQCATTATMTVVVNANVTPTFTQLGPYCVSAMPGTLPTTSTNSITGTWSPSTISTASAGSTVYTFTPTAGQCATTATMTVVVNANVTPTFTQLGPYCVGATPAALPTTSTNSITGSWSPSTISTASAGSTVYTFTPTAGQCATTATMTVVVNANVTPTFTQLGPYCVGATAEILPTTSGNGITGTWNAAISTASAGSIVYTFTPTAGQCATTATMTVVVNANVTPTFTQLGPYCVGATPAALPTTSTNSITGTWSPSTISTASAGSTVYTFTPTAGQCATTKTMTVVVNANVTPTFTQLGPYCVGATPAALPTTSTNSITGTWSPSTISTASAGSTVYTFTPTAGQCATTATMTVVVNANVTPTFTQPGPYCVGATPAALPTTSNNSITGTWSPSTISTASAGSTVYTFTPTAGQCATTTTMTVVVNANVTPTFTQLGPYCAGATADVLPTTSTNGITGTWNAAISTASAGSTVYTFTPTAGQCGTTTTMTVVVNANVTPTFDQLGPYCVGATADVLPTTSINGITGTWNTTFSTTTAGSTVYTFIPDAGQCATTASMTIVVNALPVVSLGSDVSICGDQTMTLDAGNSGASYLWNLSAATTQSITVDTLGHGLGTQLVWVEVTTNGCSSRDTILITFDNCTGMEENASQDLLLYPNPTNGIVTLITGNEESMSVTIISATGALLFEGPADKLAGTAGTRQFDFAPYATGVYFIRISDQHQTKTISMMKHD